MQWIQLKRFFGCLVLVLFVACSSRVKKVNLSMEDMQTGKKLFYGVLVKKIVEAKGMQENIEIHKIEKDAQHSDVMAVEYALDYVLPPKKDEPSARIQYKALAKLKAVYRQQGRAMEWQVVNSEQKEYQMNFVEGLTIKGKLKN